jgi:hypothetical protein
MKMASTVRNVDDQSRVTMSIVVFCADRILMYSSRGTMARKGKNYARR